MPVEPENAARILVVDDERVIREILAEFLALEGFSVHTVEDGEKALTELRLRPYDLLITDLLMPGMDGNDLVRRAKQMHPTLPTLIVSGTVTAHDRALAADAFLPKGASSPTELLERIRILVARKRGPKKQTLTAVPSSDRQSERPAAQPAVGAPVAVDHAKAS